MEVAKKGRLLIHFSLTLSLHPPSVSVLLCDPFLVLPPPLSFPLLDYLMLPRPACFLRAQKHECAHAFARIHTRAAVILEAVRDS